MQLSQWCEKYHKCLGCPFLDKKCKKLAHENTTAFSLRMEAAIDEYNRKRLCGQ